MDFADYPDHAAIRDTVAALEQDVGVRLFTRTARGAQLTLDGRVLPHARDLLRAAERAAASMRPGRRALRVDVIGRQLAPAGPAPSTRPSAPSPGPDRTP